MIRLTLMNEEYWYVNPDHIVGIKSGHKYGSAIESDHQTGIEHTIDVTQVQESPEEVARKVLEWKLAMEGYRIFTKRASIDGDYDVANLHYDELKRLAGLEEQA